VYVSSVLPARPIFPDILNPTRDGDNANSHLLSGTPGISISRSMRAFRLGQTMYDPATQWAVTPIAQTANNLMVAVDRLPPFSCVGPRRIATGNPATFTAVGVSQPVAWSAPDGTPSTGTGAQFQSTFAQPGTFAVTLSFVTPNGASVSTACSINVVTKPMADLTASDSTVPWQGDQMTMSWTSSDATSCKLAFAHLGDTTWDYNPVSLVGSLMVPSIPGPPYGAPFAAKLRCQNGGLSTADYAVVNGAGPDWPNNTQPDDNLGNNAECISIHTSMEPPALVHVGDTVRTTIVMKNTGLTTWRADATPVRLFLFYSFDVALDNGMIALPHEVPPGGDVTFEFDQHVLAIDGPGSWVVWRMGEYESLWTPTWPGATDGFGEECRTLLWSQMPTG
jgi:hypothetical protein